MTDEQASFGNNFRIAGDENRFINHGDGTFTCRRHNWPLDVEVHPDDPDLRVASCPVCNSRAAALRGAILEAMDYE